MLTEAIPAQRYAVEGIGAPIQLTLTQPEQPRHKPAGLKLRLEFMHRAP